MKHASLQLVCVLTAAGLFALTAPAEADLIAYEGFAYPTAGNGLTAGLEGEAGGTGWSGGWIELGGSNVQNGVFDESLAVGSDIASDTTGSEARVLLSTSGDGIGRLMPSLIGADGTTAWLSLRRQNNNTSAAEAFAGFFTVNTLDGGTDRSTMIGATGGVGGQSSSDGQFDLAYVPAGQNDDVAARDTANHFVVMRFDFGAGDNDTVTAFWDPTSATNFAGAGDAQISGFDAAFNGVGMTATNATLRVDEITVGTSLADVTDLGALLFVADAAAGSVTNIGFPDNSPEWDNQASGVNNRANWYVDADGDGIYKNEGTVNNAGDDNATATLGFSQHIIDGLTLEFHMESFALGAEDTVGQISGFDIVLQDGTTLIDGGLITEATPLIFVDSNGQKWQVVADWITNGAGGDFVDNIDAVSAGGGDNDHLFTLTFNTIPAPGALPAGIALLGLAAMRRKRRA